MANIIVRAETQTEVHKELTPRPPPPLAPSGNCADTLIVSDTHQKAIPTDSSPCFGLFVSLLLRILHIRRCSCPTQVGERMLPALSCSCRLHRSPCAPVQMDAQQQQPQMAGWSSLSVCMQALRQPPKHLHQRSNTCAPASCRRSFAAAPQQQWHLGSLPPLLLLPSHTHTTPAQPAKMRISAAVIVLAALLAAAPSLASAKQQGAGPAYWEEPARYPMHYPAGAAAVEGFVVNPMGGQSYCNGRLVKPGGGG
jgi:hypothetical protein